MTPNDFRKAKRGCCRACQRLGEFMASSYATRRESPGLRRRCVKSVKSRLIIFALSCFVSDALSRAFPPTRHVLSTPHRSCLLAWTYRAVDSTQLNGLLLRKGSVCLSGPTAAAAAPGSCALCSWRQPPPWPPLSAILPRFAKWDSWPARGFHSNWPSASIISLMRTAIRI